MFRFLFRYTKPATRSRAILRFLSRVEFFIVAIDRRATSQVWLIVIPHSQKASRASWKWLAPRVRKAVRIFSYLLRVSGLTIAWLYLTYLHPHIRRAVLYVYVRWVQPVWSRTARRFFNWFGNLGRIPKFAGVFAVVALMVVSGMHLLKTDAATATWTQTDWSGGVGTSTTNQFSSKSFATTSSAGQVSIASSVSNGGFESQLSSWQIGKAPTEVSGLNAWYNPGTLSLSNGADVSSWTDSSGNGRTLGMPAGYSATTNSPDYLASGTNGLPMVRYNGPAVQALTNANMLPAGTAHTIMFVARPLSSGGGFGATNNVTTERMMVRSLNMLSMTGTQTFYAVGYYSNNASFSYAGSPAVTNQSYVFSLDRNNTAVKLFRDGTQLGSTATLTSNNTFNVSYLGSDYSPITQDFGDVLFYTTRLSDTDRGLVESNLMQKYQLSGRLLATTETGTKRTGTRSVKLVSGANAGYFAQNYSAAESGTSTFSIYAYTNGSAVTSSDIQIADNFGAVSTTYTSVGSGWYRLDATVTTSTSGRSVGVYVPANKTVYVDDAGFNTGEVVSASFDSGDAGVTYGNLTWSANTPTNTTVNFQLRTSPDGSTWTSWQGPTGTGDYYTASNGSETINPVHADGLNDRYIQYRAYLNTTEPGTTPTLQDVSVTYVVNGAPEFNPNFPGLAGGGVTAIQNPDGSVTIQYSVRDEDTLTGSVQPGFVTPTFEYSIDNGDNWATIPSGDLAAGDLDNKAVDASTYTEYSATWDAPGTISAYTTEARIRVTADDGEGANNTMNEDSSAFILDTADPTIDGLTVNAMENPAEIVFTCSDDTSIEQRYGLTSDLSDGVWESYTGAATVALASDPDTVYAQCRDAYGNYTTITSAVTPETPSAIFYQDISDASNSNYRFFIAWSVIDEPVDGFAAYRVYRSDDGGANYTLEHTITNRLVNYVIDDGLSEGQEYYYVIVAEDDLGSLSYQSGPIHDVPDGSGGTDLSPPTLTNIGSSGVGATQATISWDTSEFSDSVVYYKESTIDPGVNPNDYDETQGVPTVVTEHAVVLSGLSPDTQYYYLVQSTDASGNTQVSSTSGTFTTGSGPVISGVTTPSIFNTEATISWQTDVSSDSTVFYSENSNLSGASQLGSSSLVTNHSVRLVGLTSGTQYYFFVSSTDVGSNTTTDRNIVDGVTEYYTFTTTSDGSDPIIMDVEAALIGEHGVTISWETDEISTSQVEWGLTTALGNVTDETDTYTTQHAVTITGLEDTTTYYYKVRSVDNAGNTSVDDNGGELYDFTTLTPSIETVEVIKTETVVREDTKAPSITGIRVIASATRAEVSFQTSEVARSSIRYGSQELTSSAGDNSTYRTDHVLVLRDLSPLTTYSYKIEVFDQNGNDSQSPVRTFTTTTPDASETAQGSALDRLVSAITGGASQDQLVSTLTDAASTLGLSFGGAGEGEGSETTGIQNIQVIGSTSTSIDLAWRTESPTRSELFLTDLRTGETRPLSDNNYLSSHKITIPRLDEAASYSVRITAITEDGKTVSSQPFPFSTGLDTSPLVIQSVRITPSIISGSDERVQAVVSWRTNRPSTSKAYFESGVRPGTVPSQSIEESGAFVRDHLVVIPNLDPGQLYRVRVASRAGEGREVLSDDYTMLTPRSRENIVDLIIKNFEDSFSFLRR